MTCLRSNRKIRRAGELPWRWCVIALWSLLTPLAAMAAGQVRITTTTDAQTVRPGQTLRLNVIADVAEGFHAQSHTPSDESYIPFDVRLTSDPANVAYGEPQYPAGKDVVYPALGKLNVYVDRVTIIVLVTIRATARPGPLTLSGIVHSQSCDENACFAPKTAKFDVTVTVTAGSATAPSAPGSALPPTPATQTSADSGSGFEQSLGDHSYLLAFASALLVGVIFNAMPCVLPVVPLKVMGFYEAARHDRRRCLALGGAFGLGLVTSFGVLAVLVVGMRVLSWGGVFQKPIFVGVIVIVLTAMAVGQFGFFSLRLPNAVYGFTPRHDTYAGNFLFGVLTTALSTPCTIGMFTVLLAWSLRQPAVIGVLLVMTVGVGMAAPYLILSGFPQLARRFPRTGPLGELVKQAMAFLLLATAWYFAWPFAERLVTARQFWWVLFAVIAVCGVFIVARSSLLFGSRRAVGFAVGFAALLIVPSLLGTLLLTRQPFRWEAFSDDAFARATAEGHPVLIDFTADWCGNCHALEAFVLSDGRVVDAVRRGGFVMLKADVTHADAAGVPLLDKLNPAGSIPLTVIYSPGHSDPGLLNGLYGIDDLLKLIDTRTAEKST